MATYLAYPRYIVLYFISLLLASLFITSGVQASAPLGSTWALLYADEFSGTTLDLMKWQPNKPWIETSSIDNDIVSDGALHLVETRVSETEFTGGNVSNGNIYYANSSTIKETLFTYTYGYVEACIKMPSTLGSWPAFWGLYDNWPPESDIIEYPVFTSGMNYNKYYITYHFTDSSGNNSSSGATPDTGTNLSSAYHTYGMDWTATSLVYYFDGVAKCTVTNTTYIAQMKYMYLLLTCGYAGDGAWPGTVTNDMWPVGHSDEMTVDWVHVYQRVSSNLTTSTWTGTSNSTWGTSSNWSSGAPTLSNQVANFGGAGGTTITVDWEDSKTCGGLVISSTTKYYLGSGDESLMLYNTTGTAYIDTSSSTSASTAPDKLFCRLDLEGNTTIRGNSSIKLSIYGDIIGPSSLRIESGKIEIDGESSYSGSTTVTGGTTTVYGTLGGGSAAVEIGSESSNIVTLNISSSDAELNATNLRLGNGSGSAATLTQTSGAVTASGWAVIGSATGTSTYTMASGSLDIGSNLVIGGSGVGSLSITGGNASVSAGTTIGRYATGTGTLSISGGTFTSASNILIAYNGTGTLTVSNTGTLYANNGIRIGYISTANGTVNLNGGTIATTGVMTTAGTSTWNFNGGTLQATAASTSFMSGLTNAYVKTGGAVIDSNSYDITIKQSLLDGGGNGGLTKNGEGTLTLSGSAVYTGTTTVNQGGLIFTGSNVAIGSVVLAGGSLEVDSSSASMVDISGTGTVTVGNGTTAANLTTSSIVTGTLTITAGSKLSLAAVSVTPTADLSTVPEPSTLFLLLTAATSAVFCYRRRK